MKKPAALLAIGLTLSACGIPRDPGKTLARVSGGALRVGVTHAPPWVDTSTDEPSGIEIEVVEAFAGSIGADVTYKEATESELAAAVFHRELDLMVGGLNATSSLAGEVMLTHPYVTVQMVLGVPSGTEPPEDIAGVEIAVAEGTEEAGRLAKTDADVLRVEDPAEHDGLVIIEDFYLDDLNLIDGDFVLDEIDHVMAVPHGENGFLNELERFLLSETDLIDEAIKAAQP